MNVGWGVIAVKLLMETKGNGNSPSIIALKYRGGNRLIELIHRVIFT